MMLKIHYIFKARLIYSGKSYSENNVSVKFTILSKMEFKLHDFEEKQNFQILNQLG
jgi:hypothetical protein